MSEERFDRIEVRLDALDNGVVRLQHDVSKLQGDVVKLQGDVAILQGDMTELKTDVTGLRVEVRDVKHQMHVLHEEVLDRIAAIPDARESLRLEIRAGFAEIREEFNRRLDPLELTVRDHSIEIARPKDARSE